MPEKKNRLGKLGNILTVGQWVWDRVQSYIIPAIGGGVMYYVSSITTYLNTWGPLGWGVIGIVSFLLLYGTTAAVGATRARSRLRTVQARIAEKTLDTALINPLDDRFYKQRIMLHDLRNPVGEPLREKSFDSCELVGPATLLMLSGELINNKLVFVEFVKIKTAVSYPNKITLADCSIRNCELYNVIILFHEDLAEELSKEMEGEMPWLN